MERRRILPALFTTTLLSLGLVVVSTPAKTEVVNPYINLEIINDEQYTNFNKFCTYRK